MTDKLPQHFVKEGLELASGCTLFGIPITELSHEELIAGCAQGWDMYNNQVKESTRTMNTLSKMKSRW